MRLVWSYKHHILLFFVLLVFFRLPVSTQSLEWSDWLSDSQNDNDASIDAAPPLTMSEISELRVRDIKRRLSRKHGYGADELAKVLDKKELIQMLAFEEHQEQVRRDEKVKRRVVKRGMLTAIIGIVIIMCWPLIQRGFEMAHVNFIVYTDRKKLEATRCWELQSKMGLVGIVVMGIIELLQFWLTGSILLSWVMRSKYFFPVPSMAIRPAQMMGGPMAESSLSSYGVNIGPMVLSWLMRFGHRQVEAWTGKVLSKAFREQRRAAREWESEEEKAERKARKRARKEARAAAAAAAAASRQTPASTLPADWMRPSDADIPKSVNGSEGVGPGPASRDHEEFMEEIQDYSVLDDVD